jgi:hypothetical protein
VLISRSWHNVLENNLKNGCCPACGHAVPGRWTNPRGKTSLKVFERARELADAKYGALNL